MLAGYLALGFVLEEVAFRGLVDAHVHHRGEGRRWQSALFVPHILIGLPLSFAWRRGGNLALPVGAHAAIDTVRDGLAAAV